MEVCTDCACQPTYEQHEINPNKECTCDDCYQSGFHCDCGHETCLSPYGGEYDFKNLAVMYYRYCLTIMKDGLYEGQTPLSPVKWKQIKDDATN